MICLRFQINSSKSVLGQEFNYIILWHCILGSSSTSHRQSSVHSTLHWPQKLEKSLEHCGIYRSIVFPTNPEMLGNLCFQTKDSSFLTLKLCCLTSLDFHQLDSFKIMYIYESTRQSYAVKPQNSSEGIGSLCLVATAARGGLSLTLILVARDRVNGWHYYPKST